MLLTPQTAALRLPLTNIFLELSTRLSTLASIRVLGNSASSLIQGAWHLPQSFYAPS